MSAGFRSWPLQVWLPGLSSAPTQVTKPSSPKTMFVPEPVWILSLPVPPSTTELPSRVVMLSSPPKAAPGDVVCTMPSVIGSEPKRFAGSLFEAA